MSLKHLARSATNSLLGKLDLHLTRRSEFERLTQACTPGGEPAPALPDDARRQLSLDHPRLRQLQARYAGHPAARHSKWTPAFVGRSVDLCSFRADNAYVYQTRGGIHDAMYALTFEYVKGRDKLRLLERVKEDGAFGTHTVRGLDGQLLSRDLLDSVLELNFLERTVGLGREAGMNVLDVGAGYGRLAHRLVQGLPTVGRVFCADAVPESTFLCEYYLAFRGVAPQAEAVALDELEARLAGVPVKLATNIHSFSECSRDSIAWWLELLQRLRAEYLFIVPNTGSELLSTEGDLDSGPGVREDFAPLIAAAGYDLCVSEPKYAPGSWLDRYGLCQTEYLLFQRSR